MRVVCTFLPLSLTSRYLRLPCAIAKAFPPLFGFVDWSKRLSSMAGISESFSTATVEDEDAVYGFKRSEMYSDNLAGTVPPYERHVFLCYKNWQVWPAILEKSESDPLPRLLADAVKRRKADIVVQTRLNACEGGDELNLSDGDLLIFPDMILYRDLKESEVDSFVENVLVNGNRWEAKVSEVLTGSFVFVCAHNQRDRRCGVCGPVLIDKFKDEIESRGLKNQVFVTGCTHVGQHKYAGNLSIFCPNPDGKMFGNSYGYVTPDDVGELLDSQIGKGEIVERLWRGQMSAKVKEPKNVDSHSDPLPENTTMEKTERFTSCCQGVNGGFSCCKDENVEQKSANKEHEVISYWTRKFEQSNVLTPIAVASAVAVVVAAYMFYRKSG